MPRAKNFTKQKTQKLPREFELIVRAIEVECSLWNDVSKPTRLTYEQYYLKLQRGWDLARATKNSRYVMKAAALYCMRKDLRRLLRESRSLLTNGIDRTESHLERGRLSGEKMAEAAKLLQKIETLKGWAWNSIEKNIIPHQKSHKKKAASDAELAIFFQQAKRSQFYDVFNLIEFCGARPQELEKGIKIELVKQDQKIALRCTVEGVKCDGKKKGLKIRATEVPFPDHASQEVQKRWLDLAKRAKKGLVVKVEPTDGQTVGKRITNAFKTTSKTAGVDVAAYSIRHRFSSQTKQSNKGDAVAVALALGHQSTETQRHYGRAKRGGGFISPVQVKAIDLGIAQIRGGTCRSGPPIKANEIAQSVKGVASVKNVSNQLTPKRL